MSEVGFLKPAYDGGEECLSGRISMLSLGLDIVLRPTGEGAGSRRPSHRIYTKPPHGRTVEVGSAWTKAIKDPARGGETFLTLSLDDPSFAQPVHVTAFRDEAGDGYAITWRRQRKKVAEPFPQ